MRLSSAFSLATAAAPRFILYYDQWHLDAVPNRNLTAGVTHVITAFANSSIFTNETPGSYMPFRPLSEIRALFDSETKVCMAIGGWGDTDGFAQGGKTPESYAKRIAETVDELGYDCVDIDWEYVGGNGADYIQNSNEQKKWEVDAFPEMLREIKKAIGSKELSIAVPGLERDMAAFEPENVEKINSYVDFVNVMTYDLLNRRDLESKHHASVQATVDIIDTYIKRGFPPVKLNFGIPFYAKWFTTKNGTACTEPMKCALKPAEADDGADNGKSGTWTFETANLSPAPSPLAVSRETCGFHNATMCGDGLCCSQYNWCGTTEAHCSTGCQIEYGTCAPGVVSVRSSFQKARASAIDDTERGGRWYWDAGASIFWTWDTTEFIQQKIDRLAAKGVGGIFAWSLGEDSADWSHLQAMQAGYKKLDGGTCGERGGACGC